jgi:hypothetical protein
MTRPPSAPERRGRALMGLVAASALLYPLLLCAVELGWVQLIDRDVPRIVLWTALAVVCSTGVVAAVRWGAGRPVRSPWLLTGLAPPLAYQLWLCWPLLTG